MSGADEVRNPCDSISPRTSGRPDRSPLGSVASRRASDRAASDVSSTGAVVADSPSSAASSRCAADDSPDIVGRTVSVVRTSAAERSSARRVSRDRAGVHAFFRHDDGLPSEQLVPDQVRHRLLAERIHRGQLRLQVRQVLLEIPHVLRQLIGLAVQVLHEAGVDDRRPHHHAQPESEEDRHDRDQVIPPGDHTSSFRRKNHSRTCSNARSKKRRTDGEMAATTMSIVSRAEPISRKVSRARNRELP